MLDVGEDQLLVLLLVMETQLEPRGKCMQPAGIAVVQQVQYVAIYVRSIVVDFLNGGAGEQTAVGAAVPLADGVVVRVEEVAEAGMEGAIIGLLGRENEGLEKPACVGQVPFGGLDDVIFHRERLAQLLGEAAHLLVPPRELLPSSTRSRCGGRACLCFRPGRFSPSHAGLPPDTPVSLTLRPDACG